MEYYRTHYTPNAMTTIIVGDIEPDTAVNKVCEEFNFKGRKNYYPPVQVPDTPHQSKQIFEIEGQVETSIVMYGWLTAPADDIKAVIAFDVISIILGDGQSSRLYQNLIEKRPNEGIISVEASSYTFKDGGNFFIQGAVYPDKKDLIIKLIEDEINKILNQGFSDAELKKAIKKLKVQFAQDAETISDIAEKIGYYSTVCSDVSKINEYYDNLNNITKEDVMEILKKYIDLEKATVAIIWKK